MKRKLVFLATIALMAGGMAMAQNSPAAQSGSSTATPTTTGGHTDAQGDLPAVKEGESQSGRDSTVNPSEGRPGTKGEGAAPDEGRSPKGTTPATGVDTGERGTTDTNASLPGAEEPGSGSAAPSDSSTAKPAKMRSHTDAEGDLPAVREGESQSGRGSTANPGEVRPGTKGTGAAPDEGRSPKGDLPATVDTGQKGTTDTNSSLPGTEPPAK